MNTIRNLWNRRLSEDVAVPELRAAYGVRAGRVRRNADRDVRAIRLPVQSFYRDLCAAVR